MKIAHWYYKHFNNEKLIEELSKPVEGEYVVLKEGNMLTRVKKEELAEYINHLKEVGNYYLDRYEQCKKDYGHLIKTEKPCDASINACNGSNSIHAESK